MPRLRKRPNGVSRCSLRLRRRFLPGVNMAVRRSLSARRAALAWGVGALFRRPPDTEVPRRTELRRSRAALRSSGVWTEPRIEVGSALMARRRSGVLDGVLALDVVVGVPDSMAGGDACGMGSGILSFQTTITIGIGRGCISRHYRVFDLFVSLLPIPVSFAAGDATSLLPVDATYRDKR